MALSWIALGVGIIFVLAYFTYGRFLARQLDLRDDHPTPAHEKNDGVDFVPAEKKFLLGQHFSAIAAAGPIVGPILAGLWFGWLPVLLWIIGGCIFFGAAHDFSSLVGSVKHKGASIAEIVRDYFGPKGHLFFLLFVWFSLIYVITAFTDLTSGSFVDAELGGGVAASSALYLLIGLAMGVALYIFKTPLKVATPVFLALVVAAIWFGQYIPIRIPDTELFASQKIWNFVLLGYCFVASIIPVWLLLQPRGYLGGFFLYGTLAAGVVGLFLGGEKILYPAFTGWTSPKGLPLFPILFVTVACGACSGFHGIVCSGTTSKQVAKESDCRLVGYGGMLLEGFVAIVALATVMVLAKSDALASGSPDRIYAEGLSRFVSHFGVPQGFARSFALLAFTTFIYDTLDVATRLARYIFQELTGLKGTVGKVAATLASLTIPLICVSLKMLDAQGNLVPAWKVFWTIFGTSNQLLAALTLMSLAVWLYRSGKAWWLAAIPMVFMLTMTVWSLVLMIKPNAIGAVAVLLLVLTVLLVIESLAALHKKTAVLSGLIIFSLLFSGVSLAEENVRPPHVAGKFYPADREGLESMVRGYLARVDALESKMAEPLVLIAPHAGYTYSGSVAAHAYKSIEGKSYDTVVLIGLYHKDHFTGASVWRGGPWRTPLGDVPIDTEMAEAIAAEYPEFGQDPNIHLEEHSLENHVPFLQVVLKNFKLVPIAVTDPSLENSQRLAETILKYSAGKKVLVVASTDMSHYHAGDKAKSMDQSTLELLKKKDSFTLLKGIYRDQTHELCGAAAAITAIEYAKLRGDVEVQVLKYAHSGDVTGDFSRVVGYGALAIDNSTRRQNFSQKTQNPKPDTLTDEQKIELLKIARSTLETYLETGQAPLFSVTDPLLKEDRAVFVTLRKDGQLRGCVGNILPRQPLHEAVRDMAIHAAVHDGRFRPVTLEELKDIRLEISMLSVPRRVKSAEEVVMKEHGVIVTKGSRQGVFLPKVADETEWSKEEFLSELCTQKAKLPADCWKDPKTELRVFTAYDFGESTDFHDTLASNAKGIGF